MQLDNAAPVEGRVLGVEASLDPQAAPPTVLVERAGEVQVLPLARVRGVVLRDGQAATDVSFFLDVSRTEHSRTTLTLRLAEGQHDLQVRYLAPSPTWRVSYRLVANNEGQAQLVGWGIFDNTLNEDLEDVTLTLLSGRPVSFQYALYETRTPPRPQVADDPTAQESVAGNPLLLESLSAITHELRTPLTSIRGYIDLLDRGLMGGLSNEQRDAVRVIRQQTQRMGDQLSSMLSLVRLRDSDDTPPPVSYRTGPLGDLKVSGSYFLPVLMGNAEQEYLVYRAPTPVSVRRGQSALVPIITAEVPYKSLCVYNGAKMPNHPLVVWRLRNTTGVALEQGPVTVVEQGQYRGEALLRFAGVDDAIQIPFALEFGVLVREEGETLPRRPWDVRFDAAQRRAVMRWAHVTEQRYLLTSRVARTITLLIETRDPDPGEYEGMPPATEAADGHSRWAVVVHGGESAAFTVRVRRLSTEVEDVTAWTADTVADLERASVLDAPRVALLRRLLAANVQRNDAAQRLAALQVSEQQLNARQEQLRLNLQALGGTGREATLRDRLLDDLEASEDERRAIATTRSALEQQARTASIEQQSVLATLFGATGA